MELGGRNDCMGCERTFWVAGNSLYFYCGGGKTHRIVHYLGTFYCV